MLSLRYLILLWISAPTYAQNLADTTLAHQYYQTADSLSEQGNYNEANVLFRQAQRIYQSAEDWEMYISCLNSVAYNLWPIAAYDSATLIAQNVLKLCKNHLNADHPEAARAYDILGITQMFTGQAQGALDHWKKALSIRKKHYPANHPKIADSYEYVGVGYHQNEKYDQALVYHQKSLEIRKKAYPQGHLLIADNYDNIKDIYEVQGAYDQALNYLRNAFAIRSRLLTEKHILIATSYSEMGLLFQRKKDYDQGLAFSRKALLLQEELFGTMHPDVATSLNNIGLLHNITGEFDSALVYLQRALLVYKEVVNTSHPSLAPIYHNIAIVYENKENYDHAYLYYEKALAIVSKKFGEVHSLRAATLRLIGGLYHKQRKCSLALSYYHQSMIANNVTSADTSSYADLGVERYLDGKVLFYTLNDKAKTLSIMRLDSAAHATYLLADKLLDTLRHSYQTYEDKVSLSQVAKQMYEGAIQVALRRHQAKQDVQYLHAAYYLSEKSKSVVLIEALTAQSSSHLSQIPDSLLTLESSLKKDRAFYRSQLFSEDSTTFQKKLFATNQSYDSLILVLERQYPDYHQLKYATRPVSIPNIQTQLTPEEAVISYFVGDSTYYAFAITKEHFQVVPLPVDTLLPERIASLRQALSTDSISQDGYQYTAYTLYQQMLASVVGDSSFASVGKLTIIPDGVLGYLPFDLLLTQLPTSEVSFASLPYLLHDYSVRYGYSATWLFHPFSRSKTPVTDQYIAFAPQYSSTKPDSVQQLAFGRFRGQVAPLRWNQQEVERIGEYLPGTSYTQNEAVEHRFKEEAGRYNIVHLAMHALVDDQNPMYSRLVFNQDTADTLEDGSLYAYELYNMEIPADLAVLSACETGYGKLERGEGIMSLARAFAYAGCPSIVMSHWLVDDKASAQLMDHFYRYLSEGLPKDEALRQAKLAYLETASVQKAHPFFWSNFVMVGNNEPIIPPTAPIKQIFYVVGALLLLFVLVGIAYRFRYQLGARD